MSENSVPSASDATASQRTFSMTSAGLYSVVVLESGKKIKCRVSDPFTVVGNVSDPSGNSYGVILGWCDDRGRQKKQLIPLRLFASNGHEICAKLLDGGFRIEKQKLVLEYIWKHSQTAPKAHLASRTGWFDPERYVLPDVIIGSPGADAVRVIYAPPSEMPHYFRVSGGDEDWRDHVGKRCVGNSRLVLSCCVSFAAPLLKLVGGESGGINLRGLSSIGKSTAAFVAGSVAGGGGPKGFLRSWHSTINGLEHVAAMHNDSVLILDEFSQVDPRDAIRSIYMLGNDTGKTRMNADGTGRHASEWRILVLSSGELGLQEHSGSRTKGGVEVRMLDIEADAGRGKGLFEDLHGATSPKAFAEEMKAAALQFYGTPMRKFLTFLCQLDPDVRLNWIQGYQREFLGTCHLDGAAPEAGRVGTRMALLAAAGESASEMGITGWPPGEAMRQVKVCFDLWLARRGGKGAKHDEEQAVRQVRLFFEQSGNSRFEPIGGESKRTPMVTAEQPRPQAVRDRAGFRRPVRGGGVEFLCLRETFRTELCNGFDASMVARALKDRGFLRCQGPSLMLKARVPDSPQPLWFYCLNSSILSAGNDGDK